MVVLTGPRSPAQESPPSVAAVLSENCLAMANAAEAGTLHTDYSYSGEGLSGVASRTSDLATGDFVESYSVGPISGGSGYDGKTPWMRDFSGANTPEEGGDRIPLAVNAAYRYGNCWWQPEFAGAAIVYTGREISDGVAADHLTVTPKGGKRFDAWFDARTHLLSRISEEEGFFLTQDFYAGYARRDGQMLPLVTTVDRGTGKSNYETLKLLNATVAPILPVTAYSRPTEPPAGAAIADGAPSATVPFRLLNDHIYIEARVDGKGPYTFIVDTGGHTVLSPRLVAEVGLDAQGNAPASGAGEKIASTGFAKIGEIAIGGVKMHDQTAFVMPVYDTAIEGIPVDGMVGFELFRRFGVKIDYRNSTLTFYDPKTFEPKDAGTLIPFKFYDHLPDVSGLIEDLPARFDIDTGSRGELDVCSPFVRRTGLREKYPNGLTASTGWGVGGVVNSYVVRLASLNLGGVVVPGPVGELSDARGGSFSDTNYDGNIGTALLKGFIVTFDYAHERMYLKPILPMPADMGAFDRSGLWINAEPAGYVITSVDKDSPAAEAGLAVGDVITGMDGKPAQMSSLSDTRMSLRDLPPGTVVHLDFLRGEARQAANIKLRDLISRHP